MTNQELAQFNSKASSTISVPVMSNMELNAFNAKVNNHADKGGLPKELKVLSWGENDSTKGKVILDDRTVANFKQNQHKLGFDEIALDFDHNTVPTEDNINFVKGGIKKIAAYGTPVIRHGDGLYLTAIEWTPEGKENYLNYKDLSPAIHDTGGVVDWIHSVALTPNGSVYNLSLFSADQLVKQLNETKNMATEVPGYNEKGANAGLKQTGAGKFEVNDGNEKHNVDCECANCMSSNFTKLSVDEQKSALDHIKQSKISKLKGDKTEDKEKTKTFSTEIAFPAAYRGQPIQYNKNKSIMNKPTNKNSSALDAIRKLAADLEATGEAGSAQAKVIYAFLAELTTVAENSELINKESDVADYIKPFSAKLEDYEARIQKIEAEKEAQHVAHENEQRSMLIKQFSAEGKKPSVSESVLKTLSVDVIKDMLKNTPQTIPVSRNFKTLNVSEPTNATKETFINHFKELIASK